MLAWRYQPHCLSGWFGSVIERCRFARLLGVLISLVSLAGLIVTGLLVLRRVDQSPGTAPDVSGRIVELNVRDNQKVQRDQILFQIDPEPYRLRAAQARNEVRSLEAKLNVTADQVASQTSKADAAARGINAAEVQFALASSTLTRMEPLLPRGFVTAQQVDQARTAKDTAHITHQQAQLQAAEARKAITSIKPIEADLEGARASLALAERDLHKTIVRAPCDGRITALKIAAGEFAIVGHPLFTFALY